MNQFDNSVPQNPGVEPDSPERAAKGDLGWRNAPPPRPLESPGVPFKNLRGGK